MTKTKPEMPKPQYYDRKRAAAYRGVSVMSIIRLEKGRKAKGDKGAPELLTKVRFKKGGKVFYSAEEVEAPPKFT